MYVLHNTPAFLSLRTSLSTLAVGLVILNKIMKGKGRKGLAMKSRARRLSYLINLNWEHALTKSNVLLFFACSSLWLSGTAPGVLILRLQINVSKQRILHK